MAGLIETLLDPIRSDYSGNMDKNEWRASRYGALEVFKKQTTGVAGLLSAQDIQNIKSSFGRQVTIPVMNAEDVTIANVRSCTVPVSENTSKRVVLTFVTYAFGFTMAPALYYNNQVDYETDWQKKMRKYLLKLASVMDTACVNKLNIERNQVFTGTAGVYAQLGNAFQVPNIEANDFYNQATSLLELMDFYGTHDVVANSLHKARVARLANQGGNNNVNEAFQLGGFNIGYSNRIVNAAGVAETGFIVPEGSVAMANRNAPDNIANSKAKSGAEWSQVQVPIVDLQMGAYETDSCADLTAAIVNDGTTQGLTAALLQGFRFDTDVTYISAYNSAPSTRYSPINKFEIAA